MTNSHTNYWDDLTHWFSFALHQLAYIPACCIHAIEQELRTKHGESQILHRPPTHSENHAADKLKAAKNSKNYVEKAALGDQPHICRSCGDDIISRVHSSQAHEHMKADNDTFHDWLSNDQPRLDVNEALPHASGYEQNLSGFSDEHLQRVEKYWAEHQLINPNCASSAKLATAADWERTKRLALEDSERSIAKDDSRNPAE
ncbi:MAG: hypothetical protein C0473_01570 [Cyanobacteria bacterium DS3.002]|nr:hypothetical protein [Cyanobacteria bacterium DS3.002]MBA4079417.1 hypothetical protein [Cyanobacteria bacterium PR.023]